MTHTSTLLSRIARKLTLRRLEAVSLSTTALAFIVTVVLVTTGRAAEANLAVVALLDTVGWTAAGVAGVGVEAAAFAYLRRHSDNLPRVTFAGGLTLAAVGVGDLAINVWAVSVVDLPPVKGVFVEAVAPPTAAVAIATGLALWRPPIRDIPRPSSRSRQALFAVAFALLLATSPLADVELSPVETATAATETMFDDFEDGDVTNWETSGAGILSESETVFEGHYAGYVEGGRIAALDLPDDSHDTFTYAWHFDTVGTSDKYPALAIYEGSSDTGRVQEIGVDSTGDLTYFDGTRVNSDISLSTDTWYQVSIALDYSSNTADITIYDASGNSVASITDASFDTAASNYGYLEAYGGDGHYIDSIRSGTVEPDTKPVNGTVVDQAGDPIDNATVELVSTQKPTLSGAQSELTSLSDPTPQAFSEQLDSDLSLRDGRWTTDGADRYVAIYTADDFGVGFTETADLSRPQWRQVPDDEPLVVAVGDPDGGGLFDGFQEYNRQVPGAIVDGEVCVERLGADGSVTSSTTYETTEQSDSGLGPASEVAGVPYAEIRAGELNPGFYRITVVDSGNQQSIPYVVRVGSPYELINQYRQDAEGQLTERAQSIRDELSSGNVTTTTVTTNADGTFSASVPASTSLVQVQAYKAPGVDTDPENMTVGNVSTAYSGSEIPDESVYFPSRTYRTEPGENVTIRMVELSAPPTDGNISALKDKLSELEQRLTAQTFSGASQLQSLASDSLSQLQQTYESLMGPIRANPALRESYLDISNRSEIASAENLSRSELETEIQHASKAMETFETRSPEEVTQDVADEAASVGWSTPVPEDANVTVWADYANGTTRPVSDEYISIDRGITGDTVRVEEFPLGETDPAQVAFRLNVASSNGVTTDTETVRNPTFGGTIPQLRAIDVSTLSPGPDERVRITARGEEIRSVTSATVYGPSGDTVASETNGSTVSWTTDGVGRYKVRYTVENYDGDEFTSATTIQAGEVAQKTPPTISAREGVLGQYALVGDGLDDGEISVKNGRTIVTAQLPADADTPNTVHVHTETLTGTGSQAEVRIVKGDERKSIGRNVLVEYHTDRIDEDTLVWRGENEPITRSGETKFGQITSDSDGSTITTYTDGAGVATIRLVGQPGVFDRIDHRIDRFRATTGIPLLVTQPVTGGGAGARMEVGA